MKLLSMIHDVQNINKLSEHLDGFILTFTKYSKNITYDFTLNYLEVIDQIKKLNKEVFLSFNRLFTDFELSHLEEFIKDLPFDKIDGIFVADIGTRFIIKNVNQKVEVIYHPETLLTNTFDFNFLEPDFNGAFVSKDITLKDIITIGLNKKLKLFYTGHGHMSMFYSKRPILSSFKSLVSKDIEVKDNYKLNLKEPKRPNEFFKVLEDDSGTHVFRGYVLASYPYLDELEKVVDYLVIDSLFKDDEYIMSVAPLYRGQKLNDEQIDKIKQTYNEEWHDGLLFKKTVIKGDIDD